MTWVNFLDIAENRSIFVAEAMMIYRRKEPPPKGTPMQKKERDRRRRRRQSTSPTQTGATAVMSKKSQIADDVMKSLIAAGIYDEANAGAPERSVTGTMKANIPTILRPSGTKVVSKSRNWELGLKNMEYYLAQGKKLKKPWVHCPRSEDTYSEYVVTTAEMAEVAMKHNKNIRKVRPKRVETYSRDIGAGRWGETDEAISIDISGWVRNGQHRLLAEIMADEPVLFYWSWNVSEEANFAYDGNMPRSHADKLGIVMENTISTKLPAICRAMMRGPQHTGMSYSTPELAEFAQKHGAIIEWAAKSIPTRCDIQAVVAKVALYHGIDTISPFCERFRNKLPKSVNDPAKRLWEWIGRKASQGGSTNGPVTYRKTLGAINSELQGKELRALYERDADVFVWEDNWTVPTK